MKRKGLKQNILPVAVFGAMLSLTACGSSEGDLNQPPIAGPVAPPIAPPINPGVPLAPPCLPLNGPIPFTANNAYFDSANIFAGNNPMGTAPSVGTVTLGGAPTPGNFQNAPSSQVDGIISMNIIPASQPNQPTQMNQVIPGSQGCLPGTPCGSFPNFQAPTQFGFDRTANITGVLQISPAAQQDILYQVSSGIIPIQQVAMPLNSVQPANSQVCVSGIGINMGHNNLVLYGGYVYLFLNQTQRGYVLYF